MQQGGINAKKIGYGTIMVQSVVVIPKLRDYRGSLCEELKKGNRREGKTDFDSILKQAMK